MLCAVDLAWTKDCHRIGDFHNRSFDGRNYSQDGVQLLPDIVGCAVKPPNKLKHNACLPVIYAMRLPAIG